MLFEQLFCNMTTAQIIGQILGVFVTISCVINAQLPKRWQILLGQSFLNILSAANMFLVGQGLTACIPCLIAAVHCAINFIRDKKGRPAPLCEKIFFCSLYFVAWGVGFFISYNAGTASALDLIPLLAIVLFIGSVLFTKEQTMRKFSLGNATLYAT